MSHTTSITALTLDPDNCIEKVFRDAHIFNVTLCPSASAEQLRERFKQQHADIVVLHYELTGGGNGLELINELRRHHPIIEAILICSHPNDEHFRLAARTPAVQIVESPLTSGKWEYLLARMSVRSVPAPKPLKTDYVEELRNDETGRLDAKRISEVFGIPVSTIASSLNKPRPTVDKTPDSISIQTGLLGFERIASSLLTVTGSFKGLKIWLNSPNREFDGHTPLDIIKLGRVEMLADWVDDARLGSPD
ncbi:MAG TPA: antitoxin Xre/MbcA/ParS toxin-binding domain-containing protein [Planktothrix sp.]|jgi:response regulator of citrate/malate metabolism